MMEQETIDKLASLLTHEDEDYFEQGMSIARALEIAPSEIVMILPRKRIVMIFDGINQRRYVGLEADVWEQTGSILFRDKATPRSLWSGEARRYLQKHLRELNERFPNSASLIRAHELSDRARRAAAKVADRDRKEFYGYNDPSEMVFDWDEFEP
jgi:hypothetical protein